jgi:hypothetical protein
MSDALYQRLVATAETRSITPSDVLREAFQRLLVDEHPPRSVVSAATPHDLEVCALSLLSRLPPEFQAVIRERARLLELPLACVVTAFIITAVEPHRSAQVK